MRKLQKPAKKPFGTISFAGAAILTLMLTTAPNPVSAEGGVGFYDGDPSLLEAHVLESRINYNRAQGDDTERAANFDNWLRSRLLGHLLSGTPLQELLEPKDE